MPATRPAVLPTGPRPPKHLRAETRRWWLAVVTEWTLEEHHVRLLTLAARSWDEAEAAQELIRTEGLIVKQPSGALRPHPAVRVGQEARAMFARLLRELDLDVDPPKASARPPALRSIAGSR